MDNRWLKYAAYNPQDGPPGSGRGERQRPKRGARGFWAGPWVSGVGGSLLAALIGSMLGAARFAVVPPAPVVYTQNRHNDGRFAIRLERSPSQAGAYHITDRLAKGLESMTGFWATNRGIRRIGTPTRREPFSYAATWRPQVSAAYSQTLVNGIGLPILFEIYPPPTWAPLQLEMHLALWADRCEVDTEEIRQWSSFRPSQYKPLKDECGDGGACLILADNCGSDTFDDIP